MKKRVLPLSMLVIALPFLLIGCAVPASSGAPDSVNEVQMYLIGVIASAVLYLLKFLAARFPHWTIKREWLTVGLYVIAGVLSALWSGLSLPVFGEFADPVSFITALFAFVNDLLFALAPSVAFATLIYNILLKRVFDEAAERLSPKA